MRKCVSQIRESFPAWLFRDLRGERSKSVGGVMRILTFSDMLRQKKAFDLIIYVKH